MHPLYVEFLCVTDCEKEQVTLQEGETSAFKWVTKDELISMKKDELVTERMQRFVDELKPSNIRLLPMTAEMYHSYFMAYENDPDLYIKGQESVSALMELVSHETLRIEMSMYGGFEQVGSIGQSLPRNDQQITTELLGSGDVTITLAAVSEGTGAFMWGKLKSGIGWLSLDYVRRG